MESYIFCSTNKNIMFNVSDNDYYYGEKCKSRFPVYQSKYLLGPYFVSVW